MEHRDVTGDPAVDAVLGELDTLEGRPLGEHVTVFDAVQSALANRLAETDG